MKAIIPLGVVLGLLAGDVAAEPGSGESAAAVSPAVSPSPSVVPRPNVSPIPLTDGTHPIRLFMGDKARNTAAPMVSPKKGPSVTPIPPALRLPSKGVRRSPITGAPVRDR